MISRTEASYLFRFDDICPTMKWSKWETIEEILFEYDVQPIMAVIPDNRDSDLHLETPNPNFWGRVRHWQAAGWTIGMHGFQHTYVTCRPGLYSNRKASEFAGLPPFVQREKLESGLAILRDQGVPSNLWIAPGHSFDRTTISLLQELGVTSISDGYSISPYTDDRGMFWIPQQLSEKQILAAPGGKPTEPKSAGVWTVCLHANAWTSEDVKRFREAVKRYRHLIRTSDEIHAAYAGRQKDLADRIHASKLEFGRRLRLLFESKVHVRTAAPASAVAACAGSTRHLGE
jgi:predicted deacetylase